MATELRSPELSDAQLRQRLEPHLRSLREAATLGDVVSATGLPAERTEPVLRALLDEYNGRLAVDDKGELLYSFPRGLTLRRDTWRQFREAAWNLFKLLFKIGYSIILVAYFVLFLVIMVALMIAVVAATSSSDSDLDLSGCGDGCGGGCTPLDLIWFWPVPDPAYRQSPGSFHRRGATPYRPQPAGAARDRIPVWQRVFEFVFGEEQPAVDPLAEERRLIAYIRDNNGRVTAADIVALTGQSLEEAEQTLVHLMVAHGGDVEVSDEGTLIYTFDRLMMSTGRRPGERSATRTWTWWWERPETPLRLNRNSPAWNWGIGLMNAFNLLWSSLFLFAPVDGGLSGEWALRAVLGLIPFTYSSLFFLIPLLRKRKLDAENAARALRNKLREVARKVFGQHVAPGREKAIVPQDAVGEFARATDTVTHPAEFARYLKLLAQQWEGEPEVDALNRLGYDFPRLKTEWRDAVRARAEVDPNQWAIGELAYDSEDEAVEEAYDWRQRMQGDEHDHPA